MTVRELIEALEREEQSSEVYFACDYGDRCHTMQALSVDKVDVRDLRESAYSASGKALFIPDEDDDEEDITQRDVVVLQ